MGKDNHSSPENPSCCEDSLTELLRSSVQQMLAQATEAERDEFLVNYRDQHSATGLQAAVKSSYHPYREIQTGIEPVAIRMPKVHSNTPEPVTIHTSCVGNFNREWCGLHVYNDPTPHQANQRMSEPQWYAVYDVQTRAKCREKMAPIARISAIGSSD